MFKRSILVSLFVVDFRKALKLFLNPQSQALKLMEAFQQYISNMGLYYALITCMDFDHHHFCPSFNFLKL